MDLEPVIQSEVSQKEKNKYRILMHVCGTQKNGYRWTGLQGRNRDTDVENKHTDTKGGKQGRGAGGGGGMNWEIGIDMYTLICIK